MWKYCFDSLLWACLKQNTQESKEELHLNQWGFFFFTWEAAQNSDPFLSHT